MNKILALLLCLIPFAANAQNTVQLCQNVTTNGTTTCQPLSSSNPMHIGGTITATGVQVGTTTITGGTNTYNLYDNNGVLGEQQTVPTANGGTGLSSVGAAGTLLSSTGSGLAYSTVTTSNVSNLMSTALLSGGALSIHAGDSTKFDIAPYTAQFVDNSNPNNPVVTVVSSAGLSGVSATLLALGASFIAVDKNGTVFQTAVFNNGVILRSQVNLGALVTPGGVIAAVDIFSTVPAVNVAAAIADISQSIGAINVSGNAFSGDPTLTTKLDMSAGQMAYLGINWINSNTNPNIKNTGPLTQPTFIATWRNGSGGWNQTMTDTILPGFFDNNTAGGVTHPNGVVTATRWSLQTIYYSPDANQVIVEYGQATYGSEAAAEAAKSNPVSLNPAYAAIPFRTWLIVRGNAVDLTNSTQAIFLDAGKFGLTTSGTGTGGSTTTLQGAYNNSTQPQILTSATGGQVQFQRGSAADTDKVLEVLNGAGSSTASFLGNGTLSLAVPLAVANGGTGQTSAGAALTAFSGVYNASSCGYSTAPAWCSGANIGAWVNAAVAQIGSATVGKITIDKGIYNYSTQITLPMNVLLDCQKSQLNFTPTSGVAVAIAGDATGLDNPLNSNANLQSCYINSNSPYTAGHTNIGLYLGGDPAGIITPATSGASGPKLLDVQLVGFSSGLTWGQNAYNLNWMLGGIYSNNDGILDPGTESNTGESFALTGVVIADNLHCGLNTTVQQVNWIFGPGTNFDYNGAQPSTTSVGICGSALNAQFDNVHFEQNNGPFISTTGATHIDMQGGSVNEHLGSGAENGVFQITSNDITYTQVNINNLAVTGNYTPPYLIYTNGASSQRQQVTGTLWTSTGFAFNQPITDTTSVTPYHSSSIIFNGAPASSLTTDRSTTGAGVGLTVQAGGGLSLGTNEAGGNLVLSGGISTGSGSGNVNIKAFPAGSSGTSDNSATTVATFCSGGMAMGTANCPGQAAGIDIEGPSASGIDTMFTMRNTVASANGSGVRLQSKMLNASAATVIFSAIDQQVISNTASAEQGGIIFRTTNAGTSLVEDMRLTTGGGLAIGTTTAVGLLAVGTTGQFNVSSAGNLATSGSVTFSGVTTGTNADFACFSAGGVMTLQTSACTISQRKLKENFVEVSGAQALTDVMALKPTQFNFKPANNPDPNATKTQYGFIAEEVAAVDPKLSIYENDMVTPKSYRQEAMISILVKTVQEQQKELEALHGAFPFHRCFFNLLVCAD